jgi:hypothetical protein
MDANVRSQLFNNPSITNNIMSSVYDASPNIKYRQLNKQIYNETGQFFYEKYCDMPVSHMEIKKYIRSTPHKFGSVLTTTYNNNGTQEIAVNHHYYEVSTFDPTVYFLSSFTLDYHLDDDGNTALSNIIIVDVSDINRIMLQIDSSRDFDLLTLYHIYYRRTNCTKVNKNYARNKTIEEFNNRFIVDENDPLFVVYYYYQYMMLNCYVFNMDEKPVLMPQSMIDYQDIEDELTDEALMLHLQNIVEYIEEPLKTQLIHFYVDEINRLKPVLLEYIMNLP